MNLSLINLLIQLKNASQIKESQVKVRYNRIAAKLLTLLYREGIIQSFSVNSTKSFFIIYLRHFDNLDLLKDLKIISTNSNFKCLSYKELAKITNKKFIIVLSTSAGFMTSLECQKFKLGGKVLFLC